MAASTDTFYSRHSDKQAEIDETCFSTGTADDLPSQSSCPTTAPNSPLPDLSALTAELKSRIEKADSPKTDTSPERGQWGNRAEFFLSCVGLSVGIGNVWRFPFLAYENGGGAFLIPYIIVLVLVGKPLYFMELAIGQYCSLGPYTLFKRMAPLMRGVGAAMSVVSLIVCIYYNVLMSYTVFFLAAVFKSIFLGKGLPWDDCDPEWADERCVIRNHHVDISLDIQDFAIPIVTFTGLNDSSVASLLKPQPSPEQYFERYVLQLRNNDTEYSLENPGPVIWQLALCLLLCWILAFFCLIKGIQSSGKVVYFTSTFPYVILIVLMVRGVLLEGAVDGIIFLFRPQWNKLLDVSVWRSAASQVFFSLSVSWGGLIMFGSYNKFHMKVYKDAMIVCGLDTLTSIIASIVIFSVLGNLAWQLDVPISTVAKGGQGLAFVAYPEALSKLPIPQLWAVLFFFMLFILGLDSEFGMLETVLTAVYDEYPTLRKRKPLVTGISCIICFFLALPCLTHVIDLMDSYGGGFAVILIAFFEILAVFWVYGMKRLMNNVLFMMNYTPSMYFRCCWLFISPLVLVFIFVYSMVDLKPFANTGNYPKWADGVGWLLALISIIQIPLWAVYAVISRLWRRRSSKRSFSKIWNETLRATLEWGPADSIDRENEQLEDSLKMKDEEGANILNDSSGKRISVSAISGHSYSARVASVAYKRDNSITGIENLTYNRNDT